MHHVQFSIQVRLESITGPCTISELHHELQCHLQHGMLNMHTCALVTCNNAPLASTCVYMLNQIEL